MLSIRSRLILSTASATGIILVVLGLVLYRAVSDRLIAGFDESLSVRAEALVAATEQKDGQVSIEVDADQMPEFRRHSHPDYFELTDATGSAIAASPSLGSGHLAPFAGGEGSPRFQFCRLPDGRSGRATQIRFKPRTEDGQAGAASRPATEACLTVAGDTRDLHRTLARIRLLMASLCLSAVIASAATMAWLVRRGLRPLDHLARQIETVGQADLSHRVALAGAPAELAPVIDRLNGLLNRLQEMVARERLLTADIAHELRTPLAGIETAMEVTLSQPRDQDQYRTTLARCLGIVRGTHGMVEQLLLLARAETGQLSLQREPIPLRALLEECWSSLAARAERRGVRVDWNVWDDLVITTDRAKLQMILHNLLDNAITYINENGVISIQTATGPDGVCLSIANSGSQLTAEDAAHAFDRFWRGDPSRRDTGIHCGLGLTLCARLVALLGGTIRATSEKGGLFTIKMHLGVSR